MRGMKDWGQYAPTENVTKEVDLNELAVRLGSPIVYDRGGEVLFFDNFDSGLTRWQKEFTYPDRAFGKYGRNVYGNYCLRLVNDPDGLWFSYIWTSIPVYWQELIGLETIFHYHYRHTNLWVRIVITYKGEGRTFWVFPDANENKLYLKDELDNNILIADNLNIGVGGLWTNTLKFTFNPELAKYVNIRLGNKIYDVSNYICNNVLQPFPDSLEINVGISCTTFGEFAGANLNAVILTGEE